MSDTLAQEFLVLLKLTAEYVEAAERLINALIGRLGTKDPNEALLEMERIIEDYAEAQGALKTFAQTRERALS